MDSNIATRASELEASPGGQRLGLSLIVIATAQLMLVLDDTIANIALPSIQRDLGVSASTLPWIINAYVLVLERCYCLAAASVTFSADEECCESASPYSRPHSYWVGSG